MTAATDTHAAELTRQQTERLLRLTKIEGTGWDVEGALRFGDYAALTLARNDELHGVPVRNRRAITIHVETGETHEEAKAIDVLGRNRAEARAGAARLRAHGVPV